jgi:type I restriction enzyme R subunit
MLSQFRTAFNPRIAVTVDMIATGTDIKPLEIVMFMRAVKSRTMFEQMKGRGARTVSSTELRDVTPDGHSKDHFVLIDAVGLEPEKMEETQPLERKRNVSLDKLFELVTFGNRDPNVLSSIASRLTRLDRQLTPNDRTALTETANGQTLSSITSELVSALDPDRQAEAGRTAGLSIKPSCVRTRGPSRPRSQRTVERLRRYHFRMVVPKTRVEPVSPSSRIALLQKPL